MVFDKIISKHVISSEMSEAEIPRLRHVRRGFARNDNRVKNCELLLKEG